MPITLTPNAEIDGLVSVARASYVPALAALATSNPPYLDALIAAASESIRTVCGKNFNEASYTQYLGGPRHDWGDRYHVPTLILDEDPILAITRVATNPTQVLTIVNSSSTVQRAIVSTSSTGLTLVRVAAGVSTSNALTFASYPTLTLLSAAVTALANGWSGSVLGGYESHASADLYNPQGAASAKTAGGLPLWLYVEDVNDYWFDGPAGMLFSYGFPACVNGIRVDYSAGYVEIPPDVQDTCVKLINRMYQADSFNHTAKSWTLGPYSQTNADAVFAMSKDLQATLSNYMRFDKGMGAAQ